jgi:hypothetical protein
MDDLELVDFFEQQLKSKDNFASAFEHVLKTKLKAYMKKYVLIQPGDWPCQFFSRQLVYETIANLLPSMLTPQTLGNNDDLTTTDNIHPTPRAVNHDSARICTSSSTTTRVLPPLAAAIPMIGPLHISINSREHVLLSFHPFFKRVYEHLFPHKKLPEKPKPWRISLLLEVVYGGWTLIRDTTKQTFHHCKNLQYGTLNSESS